MTTIWQVLLFSGPILRDAYDREIRRFRSHKVAALLAYLALNLDRSCPREELYEALWPEEDAALVANRFRVALASLRRQLEPGSVVFGSVLDVREPGRVRLRAETVTCDTVEFERLWRAGRRDKAAQLVTGPLLPGFYEEWAVTEQVRYELLTEDLVGLPRLVLSHSVAETLPLPEERAGAARTAPLVASPPHPSFPFYLTRFFGRESERQTLREHIETNRLVSLIGMGGIGKTRLATETAQGGEGERHFISLVSLPDAGRLYDTVLQSLGIAPQTEVPTDEQLIRVLNRRGELLLILDNAEHLNEAVAVMTLRLLESVPSLRLLVTSRQRLNIAGETVLLLTPLEAPGSSAHTERLMEFAAVSLFVDRAKNARPDFTLSERNAPAVVEICRRLEGIPLALELAAARLTSQTPQQIAHSLQTGLMDLKSRQHGLSARHQSLRAVIQGSLDLLSEEQRAFFLALSLFQGGWSLEAAQALTGCAEVEEYLDHLTVCSLVVAREDERLGTMRYALLETLREFAAELLTPEEQNEYRRRHARFYREMVIQANQEDFRFMDRLEADHENLLLAMEWFWKQEHDTLLPILPDILGMWANRGYHRLALEWIAHAFPEDELIETILKTGEEIGYRVYVDVGRYEEAEKVVQAVRQVARSPIQMTWVHTCLGYVRMMQGQWDEAVTCQRKALEAAQEIIEEQREFVLRMVSLNAAQALNGRAEFCADNPDPMWDFREVEPLMRTGLATLPENSRLQSSYYHQLMRSLWGQKREEEGDVCLARALQISLSHRHLTSLTQTLGAGAFRLAAKGCPGESIQFLASAEALQEKMGYRVAAYFEARVQEHLRSHRTLLGDESFERHWQTGWHLPLDLLIPTLLPKILLRNTS